MQADLLAAPSARRRGLASFCGFQIMKASPVASAEHFCMTCALEPKKQLAIGRI